MSGTPWIQVNNTIVKNNKLSPEAFYLFLILKNLDSHNNGYVKIGQQKLMKYLHWTNNKIFKRCIIELYEQKIIKEEYINLPKHKSIYVTFLKYKSIIFTRLPNNIINYIGEIGHIGMRLIFYYRSFINDENGNEYAFPSLNTITEETGISRPSIIKYNKKLVKYKLIKIVPHEIKRDININTGKEYIKFNNYYFILFKNIVKIKT